MKRHHIASSQWYKACYVLGVLLGDGASAVALAWLLGSYFVQGLRSAWPSKTLPTVLLGVVLAVSSGVVRRFLPWPAPFRAELLSRRGFWFVHKSLTLIGIVSLLRFVVPLAWRGAPLMGSPLGIPAASVWYMLLVTSATLIHLLPLATHSVRETADELLARDHRRPVLYLRSFEKEIKTTGAGGVLNKYREQFKGGSAGYYMASGMSVRYRGRAAERRALGVARSAFDEQMVFAAAFEMLGPYIALGRPTEDFRTMDLGAAKKYVENHEWQDAVCRWLESCAAVAIEAADSDGLAWELQQVVNIVPPQRVLVICPQTDAEYEAFRARSASVFPASLPRARPDSRLLVFRATWKPIELQNVDFDALRTLRPFFERIRPLPERIPT